MKSKTMPLFGGLCQFGLGISLMAESNFLGAIFLIIGSLIIAFSFEITDEDDKTNGCVEKEKGEQK
jgi:hypothetical protein